MKKELKGRSNIVWMHCASLGEFEQGKPVLKMLLQAHPGITPVISFFSPAGYEIIKKKNEFPCIYYLPLDSLLNAHRWLHITKPALVIWVRNEYWYFYLQAIQKKHIPLIVVSGIYRRDQPFFKWYGSLHREMLKAFTHFFVQNNSSGKYLSTLVDRGKISIPGDTRCDRAIEIKEDFRSLAAIEKFTAGHQTIVCGSTWEADEAIWMHYVKSHPEIRFIIAPHEIDPENIRFVASQFPGSTVYSAANTGGESNCMIMDNVGMLSKVYHYADIAYIGGGFGDNGLHNILEAAVYGKPVLFGPVIYRNFEARAMINAGGAKIVESAIDLEATVNYLLGDTVVLQNMGNAAKQYVYENAGASEKIVAFIDKNGWL